MGKIMVAIFLVMFFLGGYFYATWNRGPCVDIILEPELHHIVCNNQDYYIPIPTLEGGSKTDSTLWLNLYAEGYCKHLEKLEEKLEEKY